MKLELIIYDGKDVKKSFLDSEKSNVYVDVSTIIALKLIDSSGNCFLYVDNFNEKLCLRKNID